MIQIIFYFIRNAFLRTVNVSCAVRTAERVCYIACDPETAFFQFRHNFFGTNGSNIFKRAGADTRGLSVFIQKFIAQCSQHADTAVIGRAAADADDKVSAAAFYGIRYHFADAVGCGIQRALVFPDKDNACGGCHFHDGSVCLGDNTVTCFDGGFQRTMDID